MKRLPQTNNPAQTGSQPNSTAQRRPQPNNPAQTGSQPSSTAQRRPQSNNPAQIGSQPYNTAQTGLQANNPFQTVPLLYNPPQTGLQAYNPFQTMPQAYNPFQTVPQPYSTAQRGPQSNSTAQIGLQANSPFQAAPQPYNIAGPQPYNTAQAGLQAYDPFQTVPRPSNTAQTRPQANSPFQTVPQPNNPAQTGPHANNTAQGVQQATTTPPRAPRSRPAVPRSDPHQVVPADFQFPTTATSIGRGLNSGRNLLVLRQATSDPVTRVPLIIERGRTDRHRGGHYPHQDTPLPAGLTLEEIIRSYPRHAWGTMLRVFLAEGWAADRIWRTMPTDMRNTKSIQRPWNYIQAAMGREVDRMTFEETGLRRVPPKREKRTRDDDSGEDQSDAEAVPEATARTTPPPPAQSSQAVLTAANLSIRQIQEIARLIHARTREVREILLGHYGGDSEEHLSRWRERRQNWARQVRDAYADDTGLRMPTGNPIIMLRLLWSSQNVQTPGETLEQYRARVNWHAWNMFARQSQAFLEQLELELAPLEGEEEDGQDGQDDQDDQGSQGDEGDESDLEDQDDDDDE